MTTINATASIEMTVDGWLIEAEVDVSVIPGYKGSYSRSASCDADYYGEGPELNGIEDVRVLGVYDEDGEAVELDPWMVPVIECHVVNNTDDDELIESAGDNYEEPDYDDDRYESDYGW